MRTRAPHPLSRTRVQEQLERSAKEAGFRHRLPAARRYVITAAQAGAPVHQTFLATLKKYCELRQAELVIIPLRYRNSASRKALRETKIESWAPVLHPHLFAGRLALDEHLVLLGDIKITPTRQSPLTGLDAMTGGMSAIIGHTRLEFKTVATPGHLLPKIMTTTGAVTFTDCADAFTGKLAEFHHTYSALVVELSETRFHIRQLNASEKTGEFIDLNTEYSPDGASPAPRALALVLGDTHVGFTDPKVDDATFGPGGIVETLRPQHLVYHDLLDGYAVNPHHEGDPFKDTLKHSTGLHDVREEIERAAQYVRENTPRNTRAVVIQSNHGDFLLRWIKRTDWRELRNLPNALLYLETATQMLKQGGECDEGITYPSPFDLWMTRLLPEVLLPKRDESFQLADVELVLHGDQGPNGARGSIRNLRRIGVKSIIGHSHAPGISEGCYQTGTSTRLRLEYNTGPSGWLNTHCVLYANGKRALLNIIDGEWR